MTGPVKLGLLLADFAQACLEADRRRVESVDQALVRFRGGLDRLAKAVPPSPRPPPEPQAGEK